MTEATTQTPAPKKQPRGELGKGTPSSRLKTAHRAFPAASRPSLKDFVRACDPNSPLFQDAEVWLRAKASR